jgi:hypothetical protein
MKVIWEGKIFLNIWAIQKGRLELWWLYLADRRTHLNLLPSMAVFLETLKGRVLGNLYNRLSAS